MQKRIVDGVEVQRSSGNVYADLGLPDAEKLKSKRCADPAKKSCFRRSVEQPKFSEISPVFL